MITLRFDQLVFPLWNYIIKISLKYIISPEKNEKLVAGTVLSIIRDKDAPEIYARLGKTLWHNIGTLRRDFRDRLSLFICPLS
jgi:hypothetical protein